jgi:hypothetical protein
MADRGAASRDVFGPFLVQEQRRLERLAGALGHAAGVDAGAH